MQSFRLKTSEKPLSIQGINAKKYRIKSLDEQKKIVSEAKSQLDVHFKTRLFPVYWKEFDPFKNEKEIAVLLGNTYNISNAWLKCYEMLGHFKLISDSTKTPDTSAKSNLTKLKGEFMHFDNAAFPGSFILAVHHYVRTRYTSLKFSWRGSSLLDVNDQNKSPLEDKYSLYKEYKSNWLMNPNNNGDVLLESNQRDFHKQLGGKVDLYTSDLGFDVSSDYNNQELLHAYANIGQILSGLLTLKPGGCFITKQYTFFEPITCSVMYAAATFFEEFYICKPYTSREANSETYLVGIGFKGGVDFSHPYIVQMLKRTSKEVPLEVPLFDAKDYPKEYLTTLISAAKSIYASQIKKINLDIERTNACLSNGYRGHPSQNPIVLDFRKSEEAKIEAWYQANPILPIDPTKMLKMSDGMHQKS